MKTIVTAGLAILALQGCAGLRAPELPEAQKPARNVAIRLHAAPNLNAGAGTQPLALATRIYKLRQLSAFQQMPFDAFLDPQRERQLLGSDLLDVREVMLIPGQHYETSEKVTREAGYIGVVALFRASSGNRWRVAYSAADAEKTGITIGLHACALSTGNPLAPVRCQ